MIAVEMGEQEIADRQRRDFPDRGLDLVVQRRELVVDHDHAVIGDRNDDIAAFALEHIGAVAEIGRLDHHRVEIGPGCRGLELLGFRAQQRRRKDRRRRQQSPHAVPPQDSSRRYSGESLR